MGLTSRKNISDWFAGLKGRLSDGTFAPRGNGSGLMAVSPLLVFLLVYVLSSVAAGDFYKVPITAAFLIASVYAVAIGPARGGMMAAKRILRCNPLSKGGYDPVPQGPSTTIRRDENP